MALQLRPVHDSCLKIIKKFTGLRQSGAWCPHLGSHQYGTPCAMTKLVYISWLAVGSLNAVFLRTTETQDTFISLFGAFQSWFGAPQTYERRFDGPSVLKTVEVLVNALYISFHKVTKNISGLFERTPPGFEKSRQMLS